jgi:hypothetical protein
MKKLVKKLVYAAITVITLVMLPIVVIILWGLHLDRESNDFVARAVPAIAGPWNIEELVKRATPELRANVTSPRGRALFEALSRLGPLTEYDGATGEANLRYILGGNDNGISASYRASAKLQNGPATFLLRLVKRDGEWMIERFDLLPSSSSSPKAVKPS